MFHKHVVTYHACHTQVDFRRQVHGRLPPKLAYEEADFHEDVVRENHFHVTLIQPY
jgi:hypothetical protein